MGYTKEDPRAALDSGGAVTAKVSGDQGVAAPDFVDFSLLPPDHVTDGGSRQWIVRGQNAVVVYTEPVPGDTVFRGELGSEQVVLLVHDDSGLVGTSPDGHRWEATGLGLVVAPPGPSVLVSAGPGPLVQLIETTESGWAERASNAAHYRDPHPRVTPLEPWPEPAEGYRWRGYRMADVLAEPGRFGRIFRTRSFMVNFFEPQLGPRDARKLSPHSHDDFEQYSLVVDGDYVHHIQTPWGTDRTQWRVPDHARVGSPSLTVIPPPTIHTSEAIGWNRNHLIDIFAGPRADFSAQPGWVLNADDYPSPA